MTLLHDYLNTRNQQAFQRLLDGSSDRGQSSAAAAPAPGTSGAKSWNRPSVLNAAMSLDVNALDWLGRSALHMACISLENIEFVRALLKHPNIDVNLPDMESGWTPLHRALYHSNFPAALLLLQRSDTDASLKDLEGYTAFDLYNSTINNSKPDEEDDDAELFTWGANRNAALGLGDGDDRKCPDQVIVQSKEYPIELAKKSLVARFSPIHVRQVQMSKLHTAIVTSESGGNVRVCGFGSGGRLGPGQHTQYNLKPLPEFSHTIVSVALGQDHTLALTKAGEVLSWGLNRFSQLGYVVETTTTGRHEEPIQATPKKVVGPLRKELVVGVAASKGASACWTSEEVYTWGTNNGQLGYDKSTQPVQILPRKVPQVTKPVIDISITDSAMACLLITQQVECIYNDRHFRVNFPGHAFPSEIQPYRPPQAIKDAHITKIASCDDVFAALSSNGEVFIFSAPSPSEGDSSSGRSGNAFKPQRVWALRKKFSAVKDVALGSDGSIIICTKSGHVFMRTRNAKSGQGKTFKFYRIPYIQRVTRVCANSTGAFGALRVDFRPSPIEVHGNTIAQDLATIQPYLNMYTPKEVDIHRQREVTLEEEPADTPAADSSPVEEDNDDPDVQSDIKGLKGLCNVLVREQQVRRENGGNSPTDSARLPHGADILVVVQSGAVFPAHRIILAARSSVLHDVLSGTKVIQDQQSNISIRLLAQKADRAPTKSARLSITGCHAITVLILLQYLYTDELLAIWDRRVSTTLQKQFYELKVNAAQVKADLQAFARTLDLPKVSYALEPPVKRIPLSSMVKDMEQLFQGVQKFKAGALTSSPLTPDVILELADKEVLSHSAILRSRSEFFKNFFDEEVWTVKRWDSHGMIRVDMKHLRWHVMEFVLRFICCGSDKEMFETLDFVHSVDDVLDFMFDVMAAADELLLDRLVLLCSSIILAYSNTHNASYILAEATQFNAQQLVERLQSYMTVNIESFLESRMLDDVPYALVKQLSKFAREKQTEKSPVSRSNCLAEAALVKQADWLTLQDIPQTIPRTLRAALRKDSAKLSPPGPTRKSSRPSISGFAPEGPIFTLPRTIRKPPSGDNLFDMDDADAPLTVDDSLSTTQPSSVPRSTSLTVPSVPVWKASTKPRVDMKAVMAEAANMATPRETFASNTSSLNTPRVPARVPQSDTSRISSSPIPARTPLRASASPWRQQVDQTGSRPSPPVTPAVPSPSTSYSRSSDFPLPGSITKAKPPATPPRPPPPPGLGPVITPSRQPSSPSKPAPTTVRSVSGGKAWTLPPVQPVAAPSPPTSGMSFVAIQHSQLEQVVDPAKDKRSLKEIQEEERAQQEEADFLKWWTAEEERVRQEAEALAMFQSSLIPSTSSKGRGGKPKGKGRQKADTPKNAAVERGGGAAVRPAQDTPNRPTSRPKQQPRKSSQKGNAAA
ncbi:hypothetical protein BDQ12DRAFT_685375 [Crucibulum laeve]|uniref:BTB domain-containing protein n=1 Tax=Crucibulum laeve TaxID=68775 RepID=A0A5C3LZF1_9AGAR|nr:hypothetical protein BDQ12DRAFT_685375 [Crucibulum laeve]